MTRLNHIGICVRDLDESTRFYTEAFGFEVTYSRTAGSEFAQLLSMDTMDVEIRMLALGDRRIELIHHRGPTANGHPGTPANTVGFTHLAFYVDDIEAAARRVESAGGRRVPGAALVQKLPTETRRYMMCHDPNGVRVELIEGAVRG